MKFLINQDGHFIEVKEGKIYRIVEGNSIHTVTSFGFNHHLRKVIREMYKNDSYTLYKFFDTIWESDKERLQGIIFDLIKQ